MPRGAFLVRRELLEMLDARVLTVRSLARIAEIGRPTAQALCDRKRDSSEAIDLPMRARSRIAAHVMQQGFACSRWGCRVSERELLTTGN